MQLPPLIIPLLFFTFPQMYCTTTEQIVQDYFKFEICENGPDPLSQQRSHGCKIFV